jgi:protein-S-isoprenylcysteine O-methyltransferase Ste14
LDAFACWKAQAQALSQDEEYGVSGSATTGRGEGWVAAQIALLAAVLLAPPELAGLGRLPGWLRVVGLALGLIGAAIGLLAFRQLGASLTAFPRPKDDAELVQSGIYTVVRHPIYTSLLLSAIGYALVRRSIPSLALSLALALFLDRKARREEQWLAERYPEYQAYKQRVRGRLLPRTR